MKQHFLYLIVLSFLFINSLTCEANRIDSIPPMMTECVCDSAEALNEPIVSLPDIPCCPLRGKVISPFGYRGRHRHTGTDVKCKSGDTICSAFQGKVTMATSYYGYGKLIILQHEKGIETYYSHLSKCLVEAGDSVYAGQPIGLGGRTGRATTDHLHFEIRFAKSPRNSEKYFDFAKGCLRKDVFSPTLAKASTSANGQTMSKAVATSGNEKKVSPSAPANARLISNSSGQKELYISTKLDEAAPDSLQASMGNESIAGVETPDYIVIQKGDTLYSLARKFGTTVKDLQALNNMDNNLLKIGMKLKLR